MKKILDNDIMEILGLEPLAPEYVYWEALKHRKIIINDEINELTVEKVIMQIDRFNTMDIGLPAEAREPIKLYINTLGGDITIGLVLCDVIETSITPIHGICLSYAYSMGTVIMLSCHKRFAYKNSSFLIHDGSLGVSGSSKKAKDTMKFYDTLEVRLKESILNNSSISEELFQSKFDNGSEWYLWADEALALGIIDEIIEIKNERKRVID